MNETRRAYERQRAGRHHAVRGRTIALHRTSKAERIAAAAMPEPTIWRPRTRAECGLFPRPCPFVGCRFHLYLDVAPTGSIKLNFPDLEPSELAETCVLDVAERGPSTLISIAQVMNLTRERARQLEAIALTKLHAPLLARKVANE